ncbi:chemotaxis protein CheW [Paenisporosarcina cavernae]|uniref:Chemotaxis protein CheW n=1 Tax=Paenisporosarcina cavernae TaxID=2320858 RepID=A0A385YSL5_9BACL|nr:chemotaxis protein CheW [Paenisporosarcina cavernae]AYC29514.1 chemotaxis protein CheW [Paenisporosarcina cavernae]
MSSEKVVVFRSGNEEYAVSVDHVVSIEKLAHISPIPHVPDYFKGLTKIRGELVPVIDFEQVLYHRQAPSSEELRVIVVQTDDFSLGLLVLEAKEILDIQSDDLKQIGFVNYAKTKYFTSVANLENRMITIVDPHIFVTTIDGVKEIKEYMATVEASS